MVEPRRCAAPATGLWRIGRGDDPLKPPDPAAIFMGDTVAGNRFDSFAGNYPVLYFGTDLQACFGETLNRYRKDPRLAFIDDEWRDRCFMPRGTVPADWRSRRMVVRTSVPDEAVFFNVAHPDNISLLREQLLPIFSMFGHDDLDLGVIQGTDRRVTRLISQWAWQQVDDDGNKVFAGVRYMSRMNTQWECWGVFADFVPIREDERRPVLLSMPELSAVANIYDLTVF